MAKKSKKSKKMISALMAFIFGALTFGCMFLEGVKYEKTSGNSSTKVAYKGYELAFGKELGNIDLYFGQGNYTIKFSFLAVLAFLLPIVLSLIYVLLVKKFGLVSALVTTAGFIASAVLLFLLPSITSLKMVSTILGNTRTSISTFSDMGYKISIGAIGGGVCSILGAISSASYFVVK